MAAEKGLSGYFGAIQKILAAGENVDFAGPSGPTPPAVAQVKGHDECATLLLLEEELAKIRF